MRRPHFAAVLLFMFSASSGRAQEMKPLIKAQEGQIDFLLGNAPVATYLTEAYSKPIFWPVYEPGGAALTRSWPMLKGVPGESTDHIHQKSAWFCHGDVIPEGLEIKDKIRGVEGVDFWSEANGHGVIKCTKVEKPINDKNHAQIVTHNEWQMAGGTKIMDEKRVLSLHDLGKARLIVLDIDLHATVAPIVFGDTKEGALGIRINDKITSTKNGAGKIQNAEGKEGEKECWGRASPWCDYSGPIDGKTVGLAILADPKNKHPTVWHVRGYGLMAANPFGRSKAQFPATKDRTDLVRLEKGDHLRLRYGLLMHEGDAMTGQVAEQYERFVKLRGKE